MNEINVNTVKIRECGNDIMKLSNELYEIINVMFDRIINVDKINQGWVGQSATAFIEQVKVDKKQYMNMQKELYAHGKYLSDYADNAEKKINEVRSSHG